MNEYNLKQYAHIGDAVWEVFVRENVIQKAKTQKMLHELTVKYVNANFQSTVLEKIALKEEEQELVKRGRNLPLTSQKRNAQKAHRLATALEVLVGYLYINDKERLGEIFEFIKSNEL